MKNIKELTYPRNLLIELGLKELEVTTDQLAGLDKILHSLSERDTNIMRMRYIEKLTIHEIANRYSLSEGSIISIITHSIAVLKNKNMIAYIINGLEGNLKAIAKENISNNDSNEHCRIEIYNRPYFELQLPVWSCNTFLSQ